MKIKKIALVGVNAKYIHTNLAIRYLKNFCAPLVEEIVLIEGSINEPLGGLIEEIVEHHPDMIGFSAYLWNIEMLEKMVDTLKKILPKTVMFFGGPEVSFETQSFLEKNQGVEFVIQGEGEYPLANILKEGKFQGIAGVAYLQDSNYIQVPQKEYFPMEFLEFPYTPQDFTALEHKILYYETSRGCPYDCQYCMSSLEGKVRSKSMKKIKEELQIFLDHKVPQVKLVDRTFNYNKKRTKEIWEFLVEHDNGVTNFHCEIAAMLLDDETLGVLNNARDGLIQVEIGVQTTNEKTAEAIHRPSAFLKIQEMVGKIHEMGNVHQHLDLIIGLPWEDYPSFRKSFNDVFALRPHQFQLGFLKLLKGSGLYNQRETYGIEHTAYPPYEVLSTHVLSFQEITQLKVLEDVIDKFHNTGRFELTLKQLAQGYETAFDFFQALAEFYQPRGYGKNLSKENQYKILLDFGIQQGRDISYVSAVIRFDMMKFERVNKVPHWLGESLFPKYKLALREFFQRENMVDKYLPHLSHQFHKEMLKQVHVEILPYGVLEGVDERKDTWYLFDYSGIGKIKVQKIHHSDLPK